MRFLGQLAAFFGILVLLFGIVGAGLLIAAYATWVLGHPGAGMVPLSPGQSLAAVLAGCLLVLATPLAAGAIGPAGSRRRYGLFSLLAGMPDIAIAWSYLAALVAPLLIAAGRPLMGLLLAVEVFAAYTTVMLVGLSQAETERRGQPVLRAAKAGVIAVTLAFVIAGSVWVGSWVPVIAYFALAGKRILMGLLEPARSAQSLTEHQYHRCMLPLAVLAFIGVPLFLYSKSLDALLALGALNFAFMAILEMVLHARKGPVH